MLESVVTRETHWRKNGKDHINKLLAPEGNGQCTLQNTNGTEIKTKANVAHLKPFHSLQTTASSTLSCGPALNLPPTADTLANDTQNETWIAKDTLLRETLTYTVLPVEI